MDYELINEELIKLVESESNRIWYKLRDNTAFEQECYRQISLFLKTDLQKIKSIKGVVRRIIVRTRNKYLTDKSRSIEQPLYLDVLANRDDEGVPIDYQLKDTLASVEDQVLLHEKVALLAQGDSRKEMVLNEWLKGCTNDSDIARLLAQTLNGKVDTHYTFIKRFRTDCQKALLSAS